MRDIIVYKIYATRRKRTIKDVFMQIFKIIELFLKNREKTFDNNMRLLYYWYAV